MATISMLTNFSFCNIAKSSIVLDRLGAAMYVRGGGSIPGIVYLCLVEKCYGQTLIDVGLNEMFNIEDTCFISNKADDSVLYSTQSGVWVYRCYFKANNAPVLFNGKSRQVYDVIGSCFDASRMPNATYGETSANVVNWVGTVPHVCFLSTIYCEVSPLCPTSPFTVSLPFTISGILSVSKALKGSRDFGPTQEFAPFEDSQGLRPSDEIGQSLGLMCSWTFSPTPSELFTLILMPFARLERRYIREMYLFLFMMH
jgi:hypothetical protein